MNPYNNFYNPYSNPYNNNTIPFSYYNNINRSQNLSNIGNNIINNNNNNNNNGNNNNKNYNNTYHDDFSLAKSMIQTRLDKLNAEKNMMRYRPQSFSPYQNDLLSLYNMRNLSNMRGQIANPYLYSYQFMDPIYYPLELPTNGEPIDLPKIEMGAPVGTNSGDNMGVQDILSILNNLGQSPIKERKVHTPIETKPKEEKKMEPPKEEPKPEVKPNQLTVNRGIKRDWWKLAKNFINLFIFYRTAQKYTDYSRIRNAIIADRTQKIVQDISILKDWIIAIEEPFWNEFKVFEDLNVSFKNVDEDIKIKKESQKIIAMIKKYMENLISKSSKLSDVPEKIQSILYEYIKDKGYFPKKYLSTFQVNRLNFDFYGASKKLNESQVGMIIAYLIISGVTIQQILLHMRDIFVEFKKFPNIDISAKYIGSIIHYLTRDTFTNEPSIFKEIIALMNYYRNYHLFNEQVEKQQDIFESNMVYVDNDEFAEFLIPENTINKFWTFNTSFVETYKNFIFAWACKLGKLIKLKYQRGDPNLLPKKKMPRPKDKTVEYDIQIGNKV